MKIMVDQEEIKRQLGKKIKIYSVAKSLDIPISIVNDIAKGRDRAFFHRTIRIDKEKYCSCCGFRKKMPGARYLCFRCFREQSGCSGVDEHACCI